MNKDKSSSKPKSPKNAKQTKTKAQPEPTRAQSEKAEATYELLDGFKWKSETTSGEPPEWWKAFQSDKKSAIETHNEQKGSLTTYILWQAHTFAQVVLELADHIEVVGDKQSTVNKIDGLRMAIIYTTNQLKDLPPNRRKIMELHDLLKTILEQILPYYRSTKTKPDPEKNALELRKLAKRLNKLTYNCGVFAEEWPIETMTDELRGLAEDLRQYSFIDVETAGRAENLIWLIDAVFADFCEPQKELTNDEERAKSYLRQIHSLLDDVIEIGRSRRFQQSSDEIQKRADKLEHFANKLDECPPVAQYRRFWERLMQGGRMESDNNAEGEPDKDKPSMPPGKQNDKMTRPLFPKQWASIFAVSRSTICRWKKDGTYPFEEVSTRKWALPINKVPAEYLQKYGASTKSKPS